MTPEKTRWHLLNFAFLEQIVERLEDGIKDGRKANDWQDRQPGPETEDGYFDACLRHLIAARYESDNAPNAREHLAAVAANAMIMWYHATWKGD
jgi:hypothetical protein